MLPFYKCLNQCEILIELLGRTKFTFLISQCKIYFELKNPILPYQIANKKDIRLIDKFHSHTGEIDDYLVEEHERCISKIMKKIDDDNII